MTDDESDERRARITGEERRDWGSVNKSAGVHMCRKQPFDLGTTLGVCTRAVEKRTAFLSRSLERSVKQRLEVSPPFV